jgi:homoserine O-acetyltransferase
MVSAILPVCGASRCWPQNFVFLDGIKSALLADPVYAGGSYNQPPIDGLKSFGRNYAGWAYSPAFFRDELYRQMGQASLEAFLSYWENDHLGWDASDLLHMLDTWQTADIGSTRTDGEWRTALATVRARAIIMPCDNDRYFTLDENAIEAALIPGAELRPILSPYGHSAGAPGRHPAESVHIANAINDLLGYGHS